METVIQIPLYRRQSNTKRQFLAIGLFVFVITSSIVAWSQTTWGWPTHLLLGGAASLGWLAIQYRDYFFPIPQAALVLAYGELRILQKKEVCFFVKTADLQASWVEESAVSILHITAQSTRTVCIAYTPGSIVLSTPPLVDYLIYRQQDWLQLQHRLHLSTTSSTLPISTRQN